MVERPVLQHEHEDMFDAVLFLFVGINKPAHSPAQLRDEQPKHIDQVDTEQADQPSDYVAALHYRVRNPVPRRTQPGMALLYPSRCPRLAALHPLVCPA